MKLSRPTILLVLCGIPFVIGSIWIHYRIKVGMPGRGHTGGGLVDIQVGSEAPDFSANDLHGREVVLSHFRDRKVVVLDFWAIWCMPCLMAMPELQQLHEEIGGRVEVVAVNLGEDPDKVRRFVDREGYTFTVLEDPDREVGGLFGVNAIPMAVVVGTDGLVKSIEAGYRPGKMDGLRELLEQLTESAGPDST